MHKKTDRSDCITVISIKEGRCVHDYQGSAGQVQQAAKSSARIVKHREHLRSVQKWFARGVRWYRSRKETKHGAPGPRFFAALLRTLRTTLPDDLAQGPPSAAEASWFGRRPRARPNRFTKISDPQYATASFARTTHAPPLLRALPESRGLPYARRLRKRRPRDETPSARSRTTASARAEHTCHPGAGSFLRTDPSTTTQRLFEHGARRATGSGRVEVCLCSEVRTRVKGKLAQPPAQFPEKIWPAGK